MTLDQSICYGAFASCKIPFKEIDVPVKMACASGHEYHVDHIAPSASYCSTCGEKLHPVMGKKRVPDIAKDEWTLTDEFSE